MMRLLHRLTHGRLRVWWLHHGREARSAACLVTLVGCYLFASSMDYQDALATEQLARERAVEQLAQERAAHGLPKITFVIAASTPAQAQERLAEIAGEADMIRHQMRGVR